MAADQQNPSLRNQAKHFRLKVAECLRQADLAKGVETQQTFKELALGYHRLARHADSIERQASQRRRSKS